MSVANLTRQDGIDFLRLTRESLATCRRAAFTCNRSNSVAANLRLQAEPRNCSIYFEKLFIWVEQGVFLRGLSVERDPIITRCFSRRTAWLPSGQAKKVAILISDLGNVG